MKKNPERSIATLVAVVGASALSLAISGTAHAQSIGSSLSEYESLLPYQKLTSPNGEYFLALQGDGNLVFAHTGANYALWTTATNWIDPFKLVVQGDGNVVLSDTQKVARWTSGTNGWSNVTLSASDTGYLVLDGTLPYWATGPVANLEPPPTPQPPHNPTLRKGDRLLRGQFLESQSGEFILEMEQNGDLVLSHNGERLWASNTAGSGAVAATLEVVPAQFEAPSDLVLLSEFGDIVWRAGAPPLDYHGPAGATIDSAALTLQDDGNLVLYALLELSWPMQH